MLWLQGGADGSPSEARLPGRLPLQERSVPARRTGSLLSRTVSGGASAAAATLKLIRTGSAKLRLVSFAHQWGH